MLSDNSRGSVTDPEMNVARATSNNPPATTANNNGRCAAPTMTTIEPLPDDDMRVLRCETYRRNFTMTLRSMFTKERFTDVTILCGIDQPVIRAHRIVLIAASQYFERMFDQIGTQHTGPIPILVPLLGISHRAFRVLLEYMYSGEVSLPMDILPEVLCAGEKLQIRGLRPHEQHNDNHPATAEQQPQPTRDEQQQPAAAIMQHLTSSASINNGPEEAITTVVPPICSSSNMEPPQRNPNTNHQPDDTAVLQHLSTAQNQPETQLQQQRMETDFTDERPPAPPPPNRYITKLQHMQQPNDPRPVSPTSSSSQHHQHHHHHHHHLQSDQHHRSSFSSSPLLPSSSLHMFQQQHSNCQPHHQEKQTVHQEPLHQPDNSQPQQRQLLLHQPLLKAEICVSSQPAPPNPEQEHYYDGNNGPAAEDNNSRHPYLVAHPTIIRSAADEPLPLVKRRRRLTDDRSTDRHYHHCDDIAADSTRSVIVRTSSQHLDQQHHPEPEQQQHLAQHHHHQHHQQQQHHHHDGIGPILVIPKLEVNTEEEADYNQQRAEPPNISIGTVFARPPEASPTPNLSTTYHRDHHHHRQQQIDGLSQLSPINRRTDNDHYPVHDYENQQPLHHHPAQEHDILPSSAPSSQLEHPEQSHHQQRHFRQPPPRLLERLLGNAGDDEVQAPPAAAFAGYSPVSSIDGLIMAGIMGDPRRHQQCTMLETNAMSMRPVVGAIQTDQLNGHPRSQNHQQHEWRQHHNEEDDHHRHQTHFHQNHHHHQTHQSPSEHHVNQPNDQQPLLSDLRIPIKIEVNDEEPIDETMSAADGGLENEPLAMVTIKTEIISNDDADGDNNSGGDNHHHHNLDDIIASNNPQHNTADDGAFPTGPDATSSQRMVEDNTTDFQPMTCDVCRVVYASPGLWARHCISHELDRAKAKPSSSCMPSTTANCDASRSNVNATTVSHHRRHSASGGQQMSNTACTTSRTTTISSTTAQPQQPANNIAALHCDLCSTLFVTPADWVRHMQNAHTERELAFFNKSSSDRKKAAAEAAAAAAAAAQHTMTSTVAAASSIIKHASAVVHQPSLSQAYPQSRHQQDEPMVAASVAAFVPDADHHPSRSHGSSIIYGSEKCCPICRKLFPSYASMLIHKRTHTGERPYFCRLCHKGFNVKSNLLRHLRTLHNHSTSSVVQRQRRNGAGNNDDDDDNVNGDLFGKRATQLRQRRRLIVAGQERQLGADYLHVPAINCLKFSG